MIVTGLQISVTALWAVNVFLFNAVETLNYLTIPHAIKPTSRLSPLSLNELPHSSTNVRAKIRKITISHSLPGFLRDFTKDLKNEVFESGPLGPLSS